MENHTLIKGSIVLVPFPFDDFSSSKVRPALCLTSSIGSYNHIIIAFITSKIPKNVEPSDYIIRKDSHEWKGSGLIVDSAIRLHRIITIPEFLIKRRLGKLQNDVFEDVIMRFFSLFE